MLLFLLIVMVGIVQQHIISSRTMVLWILYVTPEGLVIQEYAKTPISLMVPPSYRITFPGVSTIQVNSSSPDSILKIKRNLIQHGPIKTIHENFAGTEYSHFMSLVGYGRIDDGIPYILLIQTVIRKKSSSPSLIIRNG